jgi:hypothetical protein
MTARGIRVNMIFSIALTFYDKRLGAPNSPECRCLKCLAPLSLKPLICKPGRTSRIRFRPVMNAQETANNILVDLEKPRVFNAE